MLTVTPINFDEANAFVAQHHRHHKPMPGCKFCIAVSDAEGKVRGVAMIGRPVARGYRKLITYTLPEEGGASLRAAGWRLLGERGGGSWSSVASMKQPNVLVSGARFLRVRCT